MKDLNKEKTVMLDPGGGMRGGAEQTDERNEEWLIKLNFLFSPDKNERKIFVLRASDKTSENINLLTFLDNSKHEAGYLRFKTTFTIQRAAH